MNRSNLRPACHLLIWLFMTWRTASVSFTCLETYPTTHQLPKAISLLDRWHACKISTAFSLLRSIDRGPDLRCISWVKAQPCYCEVISGMNTAGLPGRISFREQMAEIQLPCIELGVSWRIFVVRLLISVTSCSYSLRLSHVLLLHIGNNFNNVKR